MGQSELFIKDVEYYQGSLYILDQLGVKVISFQQSGQPRLNDKVNIGTNYEKIGVYSRYEASDLLMVLGNHSSIEKYLWKYHGKPEKVSSSKLP